MMEAAANLFYHSSGRHFYAGLVVGRTITVDPTMMGISIACNWVKFASISYPLHEILAA